MSSRVSAIEHKLKTIRYIKPLSGASGIFRDGCGNKVELVAGTFNKATPFPVTLSDGTKLAPFKVTASSRFTLHYENGPAGILPNKKKLYAIDGHIVAKKEYDKFVISRALSEL